MEDNTWKIGPCEASWEDPEEEGYCVLEAGHEGPHINRFGEKHVEDKLCSKY